MLRKTFIFVAVLFAFGTFAFSQETEEKSSREKRREQREQREQNAGNPFPNGPPPGVITVLGRSFVSSANKGFGNTMVLLGGNDAKLREAVGMSDEKWGEFQSLENELRGQMLQKVPKYAHRFMKMTAADHEAVQAEIEKEFQDLSDRVDKIATPELKQNARKTVFQFTGGLDSPLMTPDSVETLNLSKEQREKVKTTFKELEPERKALLDEILKTMEEVTAKGKLTDEERAEYEKKGEALANRAFASGKKLGDALRKHLTEEQLELAKKLIAERPEFMGKLPPQMRGEEDGEYRPGEDSWKPGQGAPDDRDKKKRRPFPLSELIE